MSMCIVLRFRKYVYSDFGHEDKKGSAFLLSSDGSLPVHYFPVREFNPWLGSKSYFGEGILLGHSVHCPHCLLHPAWDGYEIWIRFMKMDTT